MRTEDAESSEGRQQSAKGPREAHCQSCGEAFDPRFSRDGTLCFQCSVHESCACADDPETPRETTD